MKVDQVHKRRNATMCGRDGLKERSQAVLCLRFALIAAVVLAALGAGQLCSAEIEDNTVALPEAVESDGQIWVVTEFILSYGGGDHPGLATTDELMNLEITLGLTKDGYVAPRAGIPEFRLRLSEVPGLSLQRFYTSGLFTINSALVNFFKQKNLIGIYVLPHEDDISGRIVGKGRTIWKDEREGRTSLRVVIWTAVVTHLRTLAFGDRIPKEDRIDHPRHARILQHSPVRPYREGDTQRVDLLNKADLDRYVYRLNRHPGRRVDVSVASAEEPGGVNLDYLVNENKPWLVYVQLTNTGTDATSEWRERIGYINNQFTGNDDIFAIDFITAEGDEVNALIGSYDAPLFGSDRFRYRIYASWSEFTASEVGISNEEFVGHSRTFGAEVSANVYSYKQFFFDTFVGARWQTIYVKNRSLSAIAPSGQDDFLIVSAGFRWERFTDTASTQGSLSVEQNLAALAHTSTGSIEPLGRLAPEKSWYVILFDTTHSFFLEPLLNREAWEDTSPETEEASQLAHEIMLRFRGQYAMGERLIPQVEMTVGGMMSVRGYDESVVVGDTAFVGTAEYRFHLPRTFRIQREPEKTSLFGRPFRFAPQEIYGRPDWDLIFRTFLDVGQTRTSHKRSVYEDNNTLVGTGLGVEFQFKRYVSLRLDWGYALRDVESLGGTKSTGAGDSKLHFMATFIY